MAEFRTEITLRLVLRVEADTERDARRMAVMHACRIRTEPAVCVITDEDIKIEELEIKDDSV